jgi:cellulose 1,4-beta-cellobiosidase
MEINNATAAFAVTQGPNACGDTVASYPNVLYGCSFGNCSPASMLPMPVSALSTVTSSWDFTVGASAHDDYDVAYDIWFCPDNHCGANGFPGGLEVMIWLDYNIAHGWKTHLGSVTVSGYNWDVWEAPLGGANHSWTYLIYLIRPPMVTSVTNLDLNAFFQDAAARGYVQDSWYLYAIQAGDELRTGGVPFINNSFSVSINGVTPVTATTPHDGSSGDGGLPDGPDL